VTGGVWIESAGLEKNIWADGRSIPMTVT
jgi:hypothetical protein